MLPLSWAAKQCQIRQEPLDMRVDRNRQRTESMSPMDSMTRQINGTSKNRDEFQRKVNYLRGNQPLYSPSQIQSGFIRLPDEPGIYGWYFDQLPPNVPDVRYIKSNGWKLLYVGIAEEQTLKKRVQGKHLKGSPTNSTVQQTLASLLWKDLMLVPLKSGDVFKFSKKDQAKLLNWISSLGRLRFIFCKKFCNWRCLGSKTTRRLEMNFVEFSD